MEMVILVIVVGVVAWAALKVSAATRSRLSPSQAGMNRSSHERRPAASEGWHVDGTWVFPDRAGWRSSDGRFAFGYRSSRVRALNERGEDRWTKAFRALIDTLSISEDGQTARVELRGSDYEPHSRASFSVDVATGTRTCDE